MDAAAEIEMQFRNMAYVFDGAVAAAIGLSLMVVCAWQLRRWARR